MAKYRSGPAALQREVPWPVYHGAHSIHRIGVGASELALTVLGIVAGIAALQADQIAVAIGWFVAAGLWWQWSARRQRAWELGLHGEHAVQRALQGLRRQIPQLRNAVLLRDLRLRRGDEEFQVDHLLLTTSCALILEAKHWAGPQLALSDGRWSSAGRIRLSPLVQADRQARLLQAWLASQPGMPRLPVLAYVVFTNPRAQTGDLPPGAIPLRDLGGVVARELASRLPQATATEVRELAAALMAADAWGGVVAHA